MKFPIRLICTFSKCKKEKIYFRLLSDSEIRQVKCDCGNWIMYVFPKSSLGYRLLYCRSAYEFEVNRDYSLTILFAAMAFEVELYRLFCKWNQTDLTMSGDGSSEQKAFEKMYREYKGPAIKLKKVAKLLNPNGGYEGFIQESLELKKIIENGFPSLDIKNLINSIEKEVFHRRNAIVHNGKSDFTKEEAIAVFNIVGNSLYTFQCLEDYKLKQQPVF